MIIPEGVSAWLGEHNLGEVSSALPVGGGCINQGTRIITDKGKSFFLKTNTTTPEDMFAREAEGLNALRVSGGPLIPKPLLFDSTFLLLEDLNPTVRAGDYWQVFGMQLAALHQVTNQNFGFDHDNYIGSTPQPNGFMPDGFEFFAQNRFNFQAQLARRRGYLDSTQVRLVDSLGRKLPELVPSQPASLIYGDLWSGNAITGPAGEPALIDPAVHYGWAEAEIAMTSLFGSFPASFYEAYLTVFHLEDGWRKRFEIYNLYHLMNHLNLFGTSYLSQVLTILHKYT